MKEKPLSDDEIKATIFTLQICIKALYEQSKELSNRINDLKKEMENNVYPYLMKGD